MPDSCMCAECAPIPLTVCECQDCERKRQTETVKLSRLFPDANDQQALREGRIGLAPKGGCTGSPSCACEICRWARRTEMANRMAERKVVHQAWFDRERVEIAPSLWTRFRRWLAQDLIDRAETDAFLRGLASGQQQRDD